MSAHGRGVTDAAVARILTMIADGDVGFGGRLPPERELAPRLGVSRDTVRRALEVLEERGDVRRLRGRAGGTFATQPNPNWPTYSWSRTRRGERRVARPAGVDVSVPRFLGNQDFTIATRVVRAEERAADPCASAALELADGERVHIVERIRLADGLPLSWETLEVPAGRFPGLLDLPLDGSLTETFRRHYEVEAARTEERITFHVATRQHEPLLDVTTGQPLIAVTRTTRDQHGIAFEHSHDLFRADRTELVIVSERAPDPHDTPTRNSTADPSDRQEHTS